MLTYNFGKICDLLSIYQDHFNENNKNDNDKMWLEKGELLDEFLPFFYSYKGKILMEELIYSDIDKLKDGSNIISVLEKLLDYRMLIKQLILFYFNDSNFKYVDCDFESLKHVGKLIAKTDLPHKIKSYLMTFFLDPILLTQKLVGNMIYIGSQITNLYENQFKTISDLTMSFDKDELSTIVSKFANGRYNTENPTYYSFGILQPNSIKVWCSRSYQLVYLGLNYKNNIEKKEDLKLELFGRIFSDSGRIKILEYIRDHGSATVSEINHIFGFSGTTSYYHLRMMQEAGMVITETRRKSIYYFINRSFFDQVCSFLSSF